MPGDLNGSILTATAEAIGREIGAGAAARDADRILPHAELARVKAAGLLTARIPRSHGGPEAGWRETIRITLDLSRGDPNVGQAIQSHNVIVETLRADAGPTLRSRIFDAVLSGQMVTNAAAERGGKFYGEIATRLLPGAEGGYRLEGTKYYCTGSLFAEHFYITALDPSDRSVGVVVPADRAGLAVEDDWNGMGQRTTASGSVVLDAVEVHPDEVFFPPSAKDRRWHLQAAAQLLHAAIDTGIAQAALADALVLARGRGRTLREAGVPSALEDPYILHTIGALSVAANGAEVLMLRAADAVDAAAAAYFGGDTTESRYIDASIAVAEARIASTKAALEVSERLYEVANASGTDRGLNLDRHWRNARTHTTHDPLAHKYRFIGDYLLNGRAPPTTAKI
ncbi:MAG: acyl-CoA dehydrogenase family protein [Rhizobiaceae bacterium]|nr:acyl-CoA dehydrogenase family protein [Rhizobiaceae bacterium]